MKIIPEHSTSLIQQDRRYPMRVDKAACCLFVLSMFLSAMIIHFLGLFPTS